MTRVTIAALCLTILSQSAGLAQSVNVMPSFQYDSIGAKLMMNGYRDLRVVDEDSGIITAYDEDGSEVIILVDPAAMKVVLINYVHQNDG